MHQHIKPQHVFTCFECRKKYISQESFEKHFSEVHKINRKSKNIKCSKKTATRYRNGNFVCKDCAKTFNNMYTLRIHRSRLHNPKVSCKICRHKYSYGYDMNRHLLCHKKSQFSCFFKECSKAFRYQSLLKIHYINCHIKNDPDEIYVKGKNEDERGPIISSHQTDEMKITEREKVKSCSSEQEKKIPDQQKFQCAHCDESFIEKKMVIQHLNQVR